MSINDLLALCEKMVAEGKGDRFVYAYGWAISGSTLLLPGKMTTAT